jgi:Fic family protein
MIERPPKWTEFFSGDLLKRVQDSDETVEILSKAQREYVYWSKFKYYPFPKNIKPEEAWSYLKISTRLSSEKTPMKAIDGGFFSYNLTKNLFQKLNFIDTNGAGLIKSLTDKPSESQTSKYIISSLTEEAIASSQIEGANTTHKVAKEMILSDRKPTNKDEQMIVNNYRAMQKIEEWKNLDLTEDMLLDLQAILTDKTLKEESASGRFRTDEDQIVVADALTGEIAYVPPEQKMMRAELQRLIQYANTEENGDDFVHPVIKAVVLHFWLAYLHPFVDGNGRSARVIFYWYLLKRNYWLIQYISVSRAIKQSRKMYDIAYLHSEYDDNDFTYFLLYIVGAFETAILQFLEHFEKKVKEEKELKKSTKVLNNLNVRQLALLKHFAAHVDGYTDVITHQNKHGISRQTSNNDLRGLVQEGYVVETKRGKKITYVPCVAKIKRIFNGK